MYSQKEGSSYPPESIEKMEASTVRVLEKTLTLSECTLTLQQPWYMCGIGGGVPHGEAVCRI